MEACAFYEWTFTMEKLSVSDSATDPNASEAGPAPATFTANISGPISSDSPTLNVCYSMSGTATRPRLHLKHGFVYVHAGKEYDGHGDPDATDLLHLSRKRERQHGRQTCQRPSWRGR